MTLGVAPPKRHRSADGAGPFGARATIRQDHHPPAKDLGRATTSAAMRSVRDAPRVLTNRAAFQIE